MRPKMLEALRLLAENGGSGDVDHRDETELLHGVVRVNLATARALARRGYVVIEPRDDWEVWGSIEVQDAGRNALVEEVA